MLAFLSCSLLVLLVLGWMLHTNALDRKRFEQELEAELRDEHENR